MAKITRFARTADTPDIGGITLPALNTFLAAKGDASTKHGGSILLADETHAFRMLDAETSDGRPVEVTVTVTVSRTPANEAEQARIDAAKTEQKSRADARKVQQANERTELIEASVSTYRKGVVDAKDLTPQQDTVSKVRESLELATTLLPLMQKALPSAQ